MFKKIFTFFAVFFLLCVVGTYYRNGLKKKPKLNQQVTGITEFRNLCSEAAADETLFAEFKRHPIYTLFFENVTREEGEKMAALLRAEAPELLSSDLLETYRSSDRIGGPQLFSFGNLGDFSPATLRYLKVASDLQKNFGTLDGLHIIEIGGGHGGLCKIIHDIARPGSYTLVNNADTLALAKKNLAIQGLEKIHFMTPQQLDKGRWDLVISDYGFTESSKALQQRYFSTIFEKTRRGYLSCNFFSKHFRVRPWTKQKLLKKLQKSKPSLKLEKELSETGPENFIAIWSDHD